MLTKISLSRNQQILLLSGTALVLLILAYTNGYYTIKTVFVTFGDIATVGAWGVGLGTAFKRRQWPWFIFVLIFVPVATLLYGAWFQVQEWRSESIIKKGDDLPKESSPF